MPDERYPTMEEFWRRLDVREVEADLRAALRERTAREEHGTPRLGAERGEVAAAVARRLLPGDVPAHALAAFLDWSYDRQLGRGDEAHGTMPTPELIPAGLDVLDEEARRRHGRGFAALEDAQQDELLRQAEKGELEGPRGFDSTTWFKRTRGKLLLGFGTDPRGMVQMGYPGPSYKPGHIWLDRGEVLARVKRKRGYLEL
jgi:Gluconate 2-dehydrogenase subunit 3